MKTKTIKYEITFETNTDFNGDVFEKLLIKSLDSLYLVFSRKFSRYLIEKKYE